MKTSNPITIQSMQAAVCRYIVSQGPHMADAWKDFLVAECGLVIDEGNPYRHPMVPRQPDPVAESK